MAYNNLKDIITALTALQNIDKENITTETIIDLGRAYNEIKRGNLYLNGIPSPKDIGFTTDIKTLNIETLIEKLKDLEKLHKTAESSTKISKNVNIKKENTDRKKEFTEREKTKEVKGSTNYVEQEIKNGKDAIPTILNLISVKNKESFANNLAANKQIPQQYKGEIVKFLNNKNASYDNAPPAVFNNYKEIQSVIDKTNQKANDKKTETKIETKRGRSISDNTSNKAPQKQTGVLDKIANWFGSGQKAKNAPSLDITSKNTSANKPNNNPQQVVKGMLGNEFVKSTNFKGALQEPQNDTKQNARQKKLQEAKQNENTHTTLGC